MRAKTIATFAAGPIAAAALGAVTLPLTAWIFAPEDIGRLNLAQTFIALVINAIFLGLDQAYVREFHEAREKSVLYSTTMAPSIALFTLISIPMVLFPTQSALLLYGIDSAPLAWGTLIALCASLLIRHWSLVARLYEKATVFSVSQVVPKLIHVAGILLVFIVAMRPSFELLLSVFAASLIAGLAYLCVFTARKIPWRRYFAVDFTMLLKLLKYGLPAMISAFSFVALSALGVLSLRLFSDFDELGVYSVALSIGSVVGILQYVFNTVWSPIIYKAQSEGSAEEFVPKAMRNMCLLFGSVMSTVGLFSWIVPLFLPDAYSAVSYLLIGAVFTPMMLMMRDIGGIGINLTRRMKISALTAIIALVIGAALNTIFTPWMGASGAMTANIVALWVLVLLNTEASARIWHSVPRGIFHFVIGAGSLLGVVTVWIGHFTIMNFNWIWAAYGVAVTIALRSEATKFVRLSIAKLNGH